MARPERYVVTSPEAITVPRVEHDSTYLAFLLLRIGYAVLPILAGLDKFTHVLADWPKYLSPRVAGTLGLAPQTFMWTVGVIEIVAGLLVAFTPRFGAWVVAAWLVGIIVNLLLLPGYYDIALRDVGLAVGAIALALLARDVDHI
jgi:uncharacterized membrane protein YphA (DoxX/SURF4 family)